MRTLNKLALILLSVLCISCDDILEDDITNGLIQPIFPIEGSVIESNVVNFQWNTLDGADEYRVQVYEGNQLKVYDTLVNKTNLQLPLSEGQYHWRVRGENSAYQSTYSFSLAFSINESIDLTNQQVLLSSPVNNFITNQNNIVLAWNDLNAADYYKMEIVNNTNGGTIVYQQNNILLNSIQLNGTIITQDASYTWKVKGVNTSSETVFSSRNFSIDTTIPNQPQNSLPANNSIQIINQNINFSWTIPTDSGVIQSEISYVFEVASDLNFSNIIQTSNLASNTFQQSFSSVGDFYWRVRAKDFAGNVGSNSSIFKFTIN